MRIRGKLFNHSKGVYSIDGFVVTCNPAVNIGITNKLKYLISLGRSIEAWVSPDQVLLGFKDRL